MDASIPRPERYRVRMLTLSPLSDVRSHLHTVDVTLAVLQGHLMLNVTNHAHHLQPNDHFFIPAGTWHSLRTGSDGQTIVALINHSVIHKPLHIPVRKRRKNAA